MVNVCDSFNMYFEDLSNEWLDNSLRKAKREARKELQSEVFEILSDNPNILFTYIG